MSTIALDVPPLSWLARLSAALFGEPTDTPAPAVRAPEFARLLDPVFEAPEASLASALDLALEDLLRTARRDAPAASRSSDHHFRARALAGLDGEDAERFDAALAMMHFCRDASDALRELSSAPVADPDVALRACRNATGPARTHIDRALRGIVAALAVVVARRSARPLSATRRSTLITFAFDGMRTSAHLTMMVLYDAGALTPLRDLLVRHRIAAPTEPLRVVLRAILHERIAGSGTTKSCAALLARLDDTGLPVYVGEHQPLFNELEPIARQRMIEQSANAWLDTRGSPAKLLRALGTDAPEMLALLDARGEARPLDATRLDQATRDELLARLRRDRIARGGDPRPRTDLVLRDVVASQRIEGVDARPLLAGEVCTRRG